MTNYEKIKSMSINEMVEFLSEVSTRPCKICSNAPLCKESYICNEGWAWWLSSQQQESDEQ